MPPPTNHHDPADELTEIKATLRRIENAIIGDAAMGHVGLVNRVSEHDVRLTKIEAERSAEASQRKGAIAVIVAVSSVAGSVGALVTWAIGVLNQAPSP
jgi:hypothetical protein